MSSVAVRGRGKDRGTVVKWIEPGKGKPLDFKTVEAAEQLRDSYGPGLRTWFEVVFRIPERVAMKVSDWQDSRRQVVESTRAEPYPGHKAETLAMIDNEIAILEREAAQAVTAMADS